MKNILKYPLATEKGVRYMEKENKIVFAVDMHANKLDVKKAVEKSFDVKIDRVNTYITCKGEKRAYVKLNKNYPAIDVMTKLGLM